MVKILPIPEIREELIIAAKSGRLVPFIGAGVSKLAGCPSWNEFADKAIQFFVKEGKFNLSQFEQLKHLSPRIKLSIAKSLQEQHNVSIDFNQILHPENNPSNRTGQELYGYLSILSRTFVTTNYDNWLSKKYPMQGFSLTGEFKESESGTSEQRRLLYKIDDFTHDNLEPDTVINLHGSLSDPNSMVLTTEDYITVAT